MNKVQIGKSGILTTPIGLGTNAVGGDNLFPNLNDQKGIQIVRKGLNVGIKLLDTAYAYGMGHSEELIGQAIQGYDRSHFAIASKAAQDPSNGKVTINNSPQFLKQAVKDSLKRLRTNYLDIFYIHFPDRKTPKDQAVAALNQLKQRGIIKAIGVSNFSLAQLKEANRNDQVDVVEDQYSLLHRGAEQQLFPYLHQHNIAFVPYFPLASGLLTGKYSADHRPNFMKDDIRNRNPDFNNYYRYRRIIKAVNRLKPIATYRNATVAQIVLAWYLKNPNVSVVIPGAKKIHEVVSNANARYVQLSDREYDTIDQIFSNKMFQH